MTNELEPLKECPFCPDGGVVVRLKKDGKPTGIVAHCCYTLNREIRVPEKDWNTRYQRTCHLTETEGHHETDGKGYLCSECGYEFDEYQKATALFCQSCGAEVHDD